MEENQKVGICLFHEDAKIPTQACEDDVGYDLYSIEDVEVPFGEVATVRTGVHLEIPKGYFVQVNTRSSYGKYGKIVHHGVIDPGYTGEITLWVMNLAATRDVREVTERKSFTIPKGAKVAQLLFHKAEYVKFEIVNNLSETERGDKHAGSSGQ